MPRISLTDLLFMKKTLLIISFVILSFSCIREERVPNKDILSSSCVYEEAIQLGKRIDIPYSIENLQKAYNSLSPSSKAKINIEEIIPTHYYIRFSPKNALELDILRNIKPRIFLSEVPLDYEVTSGGTFYHDPSLPEDVPTYQYSTISVERWNQLVDTLSVEAQILIKAFMPDYDYEEINTKGIRYSMDDDAYELLLAEAYKITNTPIEPNISTKGAEWHPQGTIMAYDNICNTLIPVPGVRVRATHLLKVHEALTDTSGHYYLKSFKNPVRMKVIWESDDWDIRSESLGQATYDGPKISGGTWDLNADSTFEKTIRYAAIQRAAYRYYYGNNCGLSRPGNDRKEKIGYYHEALDDIYGDYNRQLGATIWTDIRIAGKDENGLREPSNIFSTSCHELGHATHYIHSSNNYSHSSDRLIESWARFTQYILTIQEYRELSVESALYYYPYSSFPTLFHPDNEYNFQERPNSSSNSDYYDTYTPFFIDLYDDYNQLSWPNYSSFPQYHPNDAIVGVPPAVIEELAFSSRDFSDVWHHLYYSGDYPYDFCTIHNININTVSDLNLFYDL